MLPRKQPEKKESSESSSDDVSRLISGQHVHFPPPPVSSLPISNVNTELTTVPLNDKVVEFVLMGAFNYQDNLQIRSVTYKHSRDMIFMTFDDGRLAIFDTKFRQLKCIKGTDMPFDFNLVQVVGDDLYITTIDKQVLKISIGDLMKQNSLLLFNLEKILTIDSLIQNLSVFNNHLVLNLENGIFHLTDTGLSPLIQDDESGLLSSLIQVPSNSSEDKIIVTEGADGGINRLRIYKTIESKTSIDTSTFNSVGKRGESMNNFREPSDLCLDVANNFFYVADTNNCRIIIYDLSSDQVMNIMDLGERRPISIEIIPNSGGGSFLLVKTETEIVEEDDILYELIFISVS